MAQNISDVPDPDHPSMGLKARLKNIEDPLDPQLLKNLSLFFKLYDANPVRLIKLYKKCITLSGKDWQPFINILGSTLNVGVLACEYLIVGYSEGLKVIGARDIPTMLSDFSNLYVKQQESWRQQVEEQARQINNVTNTILEKLHTVEPSSLNLSPLPSAVVCKGSATSTLFDSAPASPQQFIWEDGTSYNSKIGTLTANRDGTIAIDVISLEFQDITKLRTIVMKPKNWEYILNRDLDKLISYLSLNSKQFEGFNNKEISKKAEILKDMAVHVPVNFNQWTNQTMIITKSILRCKVEIDLKFTAVGPLPSNNLKELIQTICVMILMDFEKQLKLSIPAKQYLWHFISNEIFNKLVSRNYLPGFYNSIVEMNRKALSEGSCEETAIATQTFNGERTWELTDNWDKYVKVFFTYKLQYSTFSERETMNVIGYKVMRAPSADNKVLLLEMETKLRNVRVTEQSQYLISFLYNKRDDSKVALIPTDS